MGGGGGSGGVGRGVSALTGKRPPCGPDPAVLLDC